MSRPSALLGSVVKEALAAFRSKALNKTKSQALYVKALGLEDQVRLSTPVKKSSLSRGNSRDLSPPPRASPVDVQAAALRLSAAASGVKERNLKKSAPKAVKASPVLQSTKSPKRSRANSSGDDADEYVPKKSSSKRRKSFDETITDSATPSRATSRQSRRTSKAAELVFEVGDSIEVTLEGKEVLGVIMLVKEGGKVDIELDSGQQLFDIAAGELV